MTTIKIVMSNRPQTIGAGQTTQIKVIEISEMKKGNIILIRITERNSTEGITIHTDTRVETQTGEVKIGSKIPEDSIVRQ